MGSVREAFKAGKKPEIRPKMAHETKEIIIHPTLTTYGKDMASETTYDSSKPNSRPITPPMRLKMMLSVRNCNRMAEFFAPMDIRKPISLVRSVTVTYMMFMMPIQPTNKEIKAMATKTVVIIPVIDDIISSISCWVRTSKSSLPPSGILCETRKILSISSTAASATSSEAAEHTICWI